MNSNVQDYLFFMKLSDFNYTLILCKNVEHSNKLNSHHCSTWNTLKKAVLTKILDSGPTSAGGPVAPNRQWKDALSHIIH